MTLFPLVPHNPAVVRDALVRRGMDAASAEAAAHGLTPQTILVGELSVDSRDRLREVARQQGVECLTGEDWVLLAGSSARLAGVTRPRPHPHPRPGGGPLPDGVANDLGRLLGGSMVSPDRWQLARGAVPLERPAIVGILNVTPDSFSDGGLYLEPEAALRQAERLVQAGADLLDIGAESTRPGRPQPIDADEEWRRLEPVLAAVTERLPAVPLTVDTVRAETARRALAAGAWAINDVSALRLDPEVADVCSEYDGGLILMHSRGSVTDMATYDHAHYQQVAVDVVCELRHSVEVAEERGVPRERMVVDPGLGFAKRPAHNFAVLRDLPALRVLGCAIMVGPSRKRFLGVTTGEKLDAARDQATAVACAAAYLKGASLFRVHAPALTRDALVIAHAVRSGNV